MLIHRFAFLVLLISLTFQTKSQPLSEYNFFKEKYPDADVVCSNFNVTLELDYKNNSPVVHYSTGEEFFYLSQNNSSYNNRSIHYSSFYELINYKAYSQEAKESKYVKTEVKDFKLNDFVDDNIFFDDSKELKFMFPKIGKGDKTYIEYTYKINDNHILPKFSLSPYMNYENIVFTIKVHESIQIALDTFSWSALNLKYSLVKKGKMSIHTWVGSIKKKYEYKSDGPSFSFLSSQIHPRICYYLIDGEKVNVLNNLDDLYKWNCAFLQKSQEDYSQFKSLSDSIVGNVTDPKDKSALIFNWVQNNIRYIAFEAGYEGQIPAKASVVCRERYGDCKGISNILFNLLKSQGIEAYMVWIGTRDLPYKYTQLPTPMVDNHMICAIKLEGKYIFLDGTANNLKFGLPSPFIQGKEAMIALSNCNKFAIETVPEVSDSENVVYDSCYMKINNKDLVGNGLMVFKGFQRMVFHDGLNELNYKYILDHCRAYVIKGSNRFILDTVWFENFNDKNKDLVLHYQFSIPEFILKVENESYLNFNLDKLGMPNKVELTRNVPVEYRYKRQEINVFCLELGPGLKLGYLPKYEKFEANGFVFDNSYQQKPNYILKKSNFERKLLTLYPDQFSAYNSFIDKMQNNFSEQIILISK